MTNHDAIKRGYVDRFKNLLNEIATLREDIKELAVEAKENGGYSSEEIQAMKAIAREETMTPDQAAKKKKREKAVEELRCALGELANMPLGQAAIQKRGE